MGFDKYVGIVIFGLPLMLAYCAQVSASSANVEIGCNAAIARYDLLEMPKRGILVAAHRGYHTLEPENSIASIEAAIAAGIDIVELDVRLSKDGYPVLMHDEDVSRTTNGSRKVAALSLEELRGLHLAKPDGSSTQHTIPTLEDALKVARGRILVNIDIKADDAAPILRAVLSTGTLDGVMFFTSDERLRARIMDALPDAMVMPIARKKRDVSRLLRDKSIRLLHLREGYNSPDIAATLDERGVAGWTNALGEADEIARNDGPSAGFDGIIANRPDVIQSDVPTMLLEYLRARRLHWSSWAQIECQSPIEPDSVGQ